jgi:hypothetical protein
LADIYFGEGAMDYYEDGSRNPYNSESDSSIDGGSITRNTSQRKTKMKMEKEKIYNNVDKAREGFQSKTGHLFEDRVFMVPDVAPNNLRKRRSRGKNKGGHDATGDYSDAQHHAAKIDAQTAKQARKQMESILEMKAYRNPVMVKVEKYGRPFVMLVRSWLQVVRANINLFTWRDPYLSFWFLLLLIMLTFVLIVFPWRLFILASGVYAVGPQNIYLLHRKKKRKATEKAKSFINESKREILEKEPLLSSTTSLQSNAQDCVACNDTDGATKAPDTDTTVAMNDTNHHPSPGTKTPKAKSSTGTKKPNAANGTAPAASIGKMEVVVPYSQVKLDRFFDWPPDPSVSFVVSEEANTHQKRTGILNATRLRAQLGSRAKLLDSSGRKTCLLKTEQ